MARETKVYYEQMSTTILAPTRRTWEQEIISAESQRLSNPSAMDILGARDTDPDLSHPVPSHTRVNQSGPKWLNVALSIEEQQ